MSFVAAIQVASLGADQLSLGYTEPPSCAIVDLTWEWISGQKDDGSGSSSWEEASEAFDDGREKTPLSVSLTGDVSEGRIMPSERRYKRKALERGMRRAFGVIARYLELSSYQYRHLKVDMDRKLTVDARSGMSSVVHEISTTVGREGLSRLLKLLRRLRLLENPEDSRGLYSQLA